MATKRNVKQNFLKGIVMENPLFMSVLGTCPALATTKSIESAIGMGLLFTIVLICSNVLISLLRKIIPEEVRTPSYIVVIATFVTIVKMFANAYLPELYSTLGVFISLIVVNCVVLGRAEAYASEHDPFDSLIDALGMGLGYTLAIMCIACVREVLGTGYITFGKVLTFIPYFQIPILTNAYRISIFTTPAGAFIVFGSILAIIAAIQNNKKAKAEAKRKAEIIAKQKAEALAKAQAAAAQAQEVK